MKRYIKLLCSIVIFIFFTCLNTNDVFAKRENDEKEDYPTPKVIYQQHIQNVTLEPSDVPSIGNCFHGRIVYPLDTAKHAVLLADRTYHDFSLYNGSNLSKALKLYEYKFAYDNATRLVVDDGGTAYSDTGTSYLLSSGLRFQSTGKIKKDQYHSYPKNSYKIFYNNDGEKLYLSIIDEDIFLVNPYDTTITNKYTEDNINIWTIDDDTFFTYSLCFLYCHTQYKGKTYYLNYDKEAQKLVVTKEKKSLCCSVAYSQWSQFGLMTTDAGIIKPIIKYVTTLKNGEENSFYTIFSTDEAFFDAGIMDYSNKALWEEYNGSKYEYSLTRSGYVGINKATSKFSFEDAIQDINNNNIANEPSEKIHTYYKGYGYRFNFYNNILGTEEVPQQEIWGPALVNCNGQEGFLLHIWRQYPVNYTFTGLRKGLNVEVLTGSALSDQVYNDCLKFKSGDYLIENTWIAFTLPDYLKCGYRYQWDLESLSISDDAGNNYGGKDYAKNFIGFIASNDGAENIVNDRSVHYELATRYHENDTLLITTPSNAVNISCSVVANYENDGQMANQENLFTYLSGLDSQKTFGQTTNNYSVEGSTNIYTDGIKVTLSNDPSLDTSVSTYEELADPYSQYYNYTYTWYEKIIPAGDSGAFAEVKEISYAKNKREFTYIVQDGIHNEDTIEIYCKIYKKRNFIWNSFSSTKCKLKILGDRYEIQTSSVDTSTNILSDKIYIYLEDYDTNVYQYRTLFDKTKLDIFCNGSIVSSGKSIIDQNSNTITIASDSSNLHQNSNTVSIVFNDTLDVPKAYSFIITKNGNYTFIVSDGSTQRSKTINVSNIAENPVVNVFDIDNTTELDSDYVFINATDSIFRRIAKAEVSKDGGEYTNVGMKVINSDKDFLKNNTFFSGSAYKYEITSNGTYTFRLTDVNGVSIVSDPVTYNNIGTAHSHKLHKVDGKILKCGEDGYREYYYCEDCEKVFDKDGNEISYEYIFPNYPYRCEYEDVVLETHASTCTEAGYQILEEVCKYCGHHKENGTKLQYLELAEHSAGSEYFYDALYHYQKCSDCGEKINTSLHVFGNDTICDICGYMQLSTPTISVNSLNNELKYGDNGEVVFDISFQGMSNDAVDYDIVWYQDANKTTKIAAPINMNVEKANANVKFVVKDNKFIDAGNYYFAVSVQHSGEEVVSNVGCINLTKRNVTLTSASCEHDYDTLYFKCEEVTASNDGFAIGEGFVYSNFKSIFVGTQENTFDYSADNNTKLSNYNVTKVYGTLTTTKITSTLTPIFFYAIGGSKVYDGTPLEATSYYYGNFTGLKDEIKVSNYTGSITNENEGKTNYAYVDINSVQILHGSIDVTEYYNIVSRVDPDVSKLQITKRPITVKSIANDKAIIASGTLAKGETIAFSGFEVVGGEVKFVATISNATNETTSNYAITYVYCADTSLNAGLNTTSNFYDIVGDYDGHAYSADLKNIYASYLSTNNYEFHFFIDGASDYSLNEPLRTDAGTTNVSCRVYDKKNSKYLEDSDVTYSLTVNKRKITIYYNAKSKVYDGTNIFPGTISFGGSFVNDEGIESFTFTAASADVATGPRMCSFAYALKSNTKADNYNITTDGKVNYVVKVYPAPLIIESASSSKIYDGTPLTANTITVVDGSRLVSGHTIQATLLNAGITDFGEIKNEFTNAGVKDKDGNDVSANYTITTLDGTLSILKRDITITSSSANKVYDGSALSNHDTTITSGTLVAGDSIECNNFASITNAGSVNNSFDIVENKNYQATKQYGSLIVEKSPITLKSSSQTKQYDGTMLTDENVEITNGQLYGSDSFSYEFYGKQIEAGSSDNDFVVTGESTKNYQITKDEGTLTVTNITSPITITTSSASKEYDGTPLKSDSFTYTDDVLLSGDVLEVTLSEAINAGTIKNDIQDIHVYRGDIDVTSSYIFANPILGNLKITPKEVTISPNDATTTYGETPHFTAKVTGLLNNDSVEYQFDINGATDAGKHPIKIKANEYQGNYHVVTSTATLIINKANTMSLSANNKCVNYTGTALSVIPNCNVDGATLTYQTKKNENDEYGASSKIVPSITNASTLYVLATANHKNYESTSVEYSIEVVKAIFRAPDISIHNETYLGQNDGYVKGLSSDMEYKVNGSDSYYPISEDVLVDETKLMVVPGIYYFRYKENNNHYASQFVTVKISEGNKIKITYNGEVIQECEYGDTISQPSIEQKAGYVFIGFYSDPNFNHRWNFAKDVATQDITLYALYQSEEDTSPDEIIEKEDIKKDSKNATVDDTKNETTQEDPKNETKDETIKEDNPDTKKDDDKKDTSEVADVEESKSNLSIVPIVIGFVVLATGGIFIIIKKKGFKD